MHRPWRTFAALINRGLSGKTSGLDKLLLSRAQILWGMYYQKNVDYVELLWEDFIYQIDNRVYKKQEKMYYPRFMKAVIHHFLIQDKTLSWRNKIRMHTSKDDYLINTLRFVSAKESTQIYGKLLPETLTSLEMKESKTYKTYLGYASGAIAPKIARKFKKASPSKKDSSLVLVDDKPDKKGKRVKRSAKKCITTPATGIVISEAPMETQNKRKEKVDVAHGKGIELLSEVALAKKTQMKEVKKEFGGILQDTNNMQTQTSNTLHNAIMEADSKDRPPMLALGNYVQWKSRIKRYIDTKPNQELIHYYLTHPPYELGWKEKFVLDSEGHPTTTTERVFETYKNVTQDIRDQLNAEAEVV
nr:hypothetical protein [Tanacetum cinerariifolium]